MYEMYPLLEFYKGFPESIKYPPVSMFQALMLSLERNHDSIAYDFMGTMATYRTFVILKDPAQAGKDMEKTLIDHCMKSLIKWSCPREIEFREILQTTLMGMPKKNLNRKSWND